MHKFILLVVIASTSFGNIAFAEPRQRLDPAQADIEEVEPSFEKRSDHGDSVKGPNAYGKPSTKEGQDRLGNSDTPGTPEKNDTSTDSR